MSKRSRLKGRIEGLEALIEVSGVDIANQIKAVKALGKESVDLYKQFNQNFGQIMVGKIKSKLPKDSGALASSVRSAKLQDGNTRASRAKVTSTPVAYRTRIQLNFKTEIRAPRAQRSTRATKTNLVLSET